MTFVESLRATKNEAQESTFDEGDEVIAQINNEPSMTEEIEKEAQEGDEVIAEINNEPSTTEEMTDEKEELVVADVDRVEDELKDAQTQKSANDEAAQESTVDEEDEVIAEVNMGL